MIRDNCCSGEDCCPEEGEHWDADARKCVETTDEPECECEGCCDFDCCDELDYFLHKAYHEMYSNEYNSYEEYYDDWYDEFKAWWYGEGSEAEVEIPEV